jgi:hypothetical protein
MLYWWHCLFWLSVLAVLGEPEEEHVAQVSMEWFECFLQETSVSLTSGTLWCVRKIPVLF